MADVNKVLGSELSLCSTSVAETSSTGWMTPGFRLNLDQLGADRNHHFRYVALRWWMQHLASGVMIAMLPVGVYGFTMCNVLRQLHVWDSAVSGLQIDCRIFIVFYSTYTYTYSVSAYCHLLVIFR